MSPTRRQVVGGAVGAALASPASVRAAFQNPGPDELLRTAEYRALLDSAGVELARRRLKHFVSRAWHTVEPHTEFRPNWHIDTICDHLEAIEAGHITNLLVTMPPRMMKSLTISVFYPAWRWIDRPEIRFLYASYSGDLATAHSVATRRVIQSDWYQRNWGDRFRLAWDQNLKTRFENDHMGQRFATSVGGAGTGMGGDRVIVDDPHKVQESESPTKRREAIEWWDKTMSTRLNDQSTGARIVIMQRVHQDDVAGHVLERGDYVHLNLPMEYEPAATHWTGFGSPDPRTEPGELLAPDRVDAEQNEQLKRTLGERGYASQFQQRPAPAEGAILKKRWWRYWHPRGESWPPVEVEMPDGTVEYVESVPLPERMAEIVSSWDCAFKDTKSSSYVVGQVWGATGADRWLLDQVRDFLDFPATIDAVRSQVVKWPKITRKYVEDKANGPAVIATLRREIAGMLAVNPQGGKEVRAHAVSHQIESGNVFLPHPRLYAWVEGLIDEAAFFPFGKYDDQVDAMTQALFKLESRSAEVATMSVVPFTSLFPATDGVRVGEASEWESPWG